VPISDRYAGFAPEMVRYAPFGALRRILYSLLSDLNSLFGANKFPVIRFEIPCSAPREFRPKGFGIPPLAGPFLRDRASRKYEIPC
jgi:hypothetical protein